MPPSSEGRISGWISWWRLFRLLPCMKICKGRKTKMQPGQPLLLQMPKLARMAVRYPLPGLVFEEGPYDGVERVDVPGLVHKVDSSEPGRKTVL